MNSDSLALSEIDPQRPRYLGLSWPSDVSDISDSHFRSAFSAGPRLVCIDVAHPDPADGRPALWIG